eukprot:CAMPEP_0194198560 /NCGR_PEP_ID=MMETSP0154-20130528/77831_1 /TAXON_ID=1049557 /ORGANISM="Thalassiothrix antarctica, Strain L6-D1" /LENGTH=391 /DNA_ID=CAMNT_0038923361 /DNA_START=89 /DNA_END=1263 /DNA_ORIENTATION=+
MKISRRKLYLLSRSFFWVALTIIASCLTFRRRSDERIRFLRKHQRQLKFFDPRTVDSKNTGATSAKNEEYVSLASSSNLIRNEGVVAVSDATAAEVFSILRVKSTDEAAKMKCSKPVTMYDSAPPHENPRYNCAYHHLPLPEAYTCGSIQIPYDADPLGMAMSFQESSDGSNWVIGIGSFAPRSFHAAIEASPFTYQGMYQNLVTNEGLVERVHAYNAKSGPTQAFDDYKGKPLLDNATGVWKGPIACVSSGPNIYLTDLCPASEAPVPVLVVDDAMTDFNAGAALLYLKVDVGGEEYKALLGAKTVFSSPQTRPCYVYIKLTHTNSEAFHLLRDEYDYVNYADLDSGLHGEDSYPPQGKFRPNEGNYEFRLAENEEKPCAARVQRAAATR